MNKRRDFRVGDRVWDMWILEWGTVTDIAKEEESPIQVEFDCGFIGYYNAFGETIHKNFRRLFFSNIFENPPLEAIEKPDVPNLKKDAKIMVWDLNGDPVPRHFHHFGDNGGVFVYSRGRSMFTSECAGLEKWKFWELAEKQGKKE